MMIHTYVIWKSPVPTPIDYFICLLNQLTKKWWGECMDFCTSEKFSSSKKIQHFSFREITTLLAQVERSDTYFSIIGIHLSSDFLSYVR